MRTVKTIRPTRYFYFLMILVTLLVMSKLGCISPEARGGGRPSVAHQAPIPPTP